MKRLIELDRERNLLSHIGAILGWDQETYMPPKGIEERSEQLALIEGLAHEKAVCADVGALIAELEGSADLDSTERAYLRVARREYNRETKLPSALVTQMAKQTSLTQAAWVQARKSNDFAGFAPYLQKMVDLNLDMASALDPHAPPYDVLLDLYEIGSDEKSIGSVFEVMKKDLMGILGKITSRPQVDDSFLRSKVSKESQAAISEYIMTALGFDRSRGRLDVTAHPFTTTLGREDIRITTRYMEEFFPSGIFSTIHEAGHALYEMGIDPHPEYRGTRLAEATSMGIHESQSRMLENVIGRSSHFWKKHYDRIVSLADKALDGVTLERFIKAVNKVEPSLIRVEADEVTYGLHIIARFELESAIIGGRLKVLDIPEAWNAKMKELLGVEVPNDAQGCLQDIHWSMGAFGYFPSYALGNLYAAQFWATMNKAMPGLVDDISSGSLAEVAGWLKKNIHELGSAYLPSELVFNVTGTPLNPAHFARYLEEKYSKIYGF
jgi:carboxypeptidase Taq